MKKVTLDLVLENIDIYTDRIKDWAVFVYPTDSLYGIGAMATRKNIEKISSLKNRGENKKMSIIAPSFERIEERFILENKDFLYQHFKKLSATTFVIEPKENYKELLFYGNSNDTTLWVRIINHPLQKIVEHLNEPIISTSANMAWEKNIVTIDEIDKKIVDGVDFIIDWGSVRWKPSSLLFDKTREIITRI